jgi:hypothetical protein
MPAMPVARIDLFTVRSVNADLAPRDGRLLHLGIGEAPIGLQGTFSLWRDVHAMRAFAYAALPTATSSTAARPSTGTPRSCSRGSP